MPRNNDTPIIQDGDAEITGQLQAGSVAVQNRVLAQINDQLAVDGAVLITEEQRNAMNGYAGLDESGKLLAEVLPEISISRVFVVSSEEAQIALEADEGDLAIRSDLSRSFVHTGGATGTFADWLELARTSDHVYSVAGKVGAVELETEDINGLDDALDGKANTSHEHVLSEITDAGTAADKNTPASGDASSSEVVLGSDTRLTDAREPTSHTHPISDVTDLGDELDGKADLSHTHSKTDITDAGTAISKDAPASGDATSSQVVLGSDTRLTDARTPTPHSHEISDVTNLQTSLDGKAASSHTHTASQITDAGTAATKNVPSSGNASSTEVVLGSDTRLSDARTPTSHTHTLSAITDAGTAASRNVALSGNASSSEVVKGDDTRLSDTRDPKAHTHTLSSITDAGTAASKDVPSSGNASGSQVVKGDDTRLTDSRTPTSHTHTLSAITDAGTSASKNVASSGNASSTEVVKGDDTRLTDTRDPKAHTHTLSNITDAGTAAFKNVATSGDASSSQVVQGNDTRLTNSRTPTAHKSTHATGGSDALSPSDIGAAASSHTHTLSAITDAGTSASKNVASTGNASTAQVVQGNDTRLAKAGVYAFGPNTNALLGVGHSYNTTPATTQIVLPGKVTSIATYSSCGAIIDGKLFTWGSSANGQLGNNTTTPSLNVAAQVGSDTNWASIQCGSNHMIALKTTGTLWSWGSPSSGQLGNGLGGASADVLVPTQVGTDSDWSAIATGVGHTLALKTNGEMWSWGLGNNGRLGNGSTSGLLSPTRVGSDTDWVAISAGEAHSLAIKSDGTLWSCGNALNGRLGNNTTTPDVTSFTKVGTATDWLAVSGGNAHSLAIKTNGTLWSWGAAANGRLGNGATSPDVLVPTQVNGLAWQAIEAGGTQSLGIREGQIYGWGSAGNTVPTNISLVPNWTLLAGNTNVHMSLFAMS